jgi:hypothetical protein
MWMGRSAAVINHQGSVQGEDGQGQETYRLRRAIDRLERT